MANGSINHAFVIKPQHKLGEAFWLVNTSMCVLETRRALTAWGQNTEALHLGPFRTYPLYLFIWLFLIYILYNKTITTSIALS